MTKMKDAIVKRAEASQGKPGTIRSINSVISYDKVPDDATRKKIAVETGDALKAHFSKGGKADQTIAKSAKKGARKGAAVGGASGAAVGAGVGKVLGDAAKKALQKHRKGGKLIKHLSTGATAAGAVAGGAVGGKKGHRAGKATGTTFGHAASLRNYQQEGQDRLKSHGVKGHHLTNVKYNHGSEGGLMMGSKEGLASLRSKTKKQ